MRVIYIELLSYCITLTLGITLQDGLVWLVWVLHGNGLWEFSQHPLLEGL